MRRHHKNPGTVPRTDIRGRSKSTDSTPRRSRSRLPQTYNNVLPTEDSNPQNQHLGERGTADIPTDFTTSKPTPRFLKTHFQSFTGEHSKLMEELFCL